MRWGAGRMVLGIDLGWRNSAKLSSCASHRLARPLIRFQWVQHHHSWVYLGHRERVVNWSVSKSDLHLRWSSMPI
jgi:hypothetical protein